MPDKRRHRGTHPDDARLFEPAVHSRLRCAVSDLSWLLSHGYAAVSTLKLVGDRYELELRQRTAVSRCACSDEAYNRRQQSQAKLSALAGECLLIDGFNVLTSIEAALASGVILHARGGCYRDIASVHGSWRKVQETLSAIELLGRFLAQFQPRNVAWYLDRPVSNSGRLKSVLRTIATEQSWPWEIELVQNPDRILSETPHLIATADSEILDHCGRWVNLARAVIEQQIPRAAIVDLSLRT